MRNEREKEIEHVKPNSNFKSPNGERRVVLKQRHSISKPPGESRVDVQSFILHPTTSSARIRPSSVLNT